MFTEDERKVLSLLAAGHSDDEAARRLHWSRRSFERRVHAAVHKLGARTRFQAGFLLARSGWLDEEEVSDCGRTS